MQSDTTRNPWNLGLLAVLFLASLAVDGCQAVPPPTGPAQMTFRVADYEDFVDETLTLMRLYDLPPEYVDRRAGLILSRPTTRGQWFEPWRVDSRGGYQMLESSLHTIRSVVTIHLDRVSSDAPGQDAETPASASLPASTATLPAGVSTMPVASEEPIGGVYRVTVQVDKQRYSSPERQVTTASGALAIYSERLPTTEGLRADRAQVDWVPLGRDALLEEFLLTRIAERVPGIERED